ncbi:MAG: hypothetical protein JWQ04_2183 [Pedosphaera sp.]|nr:hypothetical protein [Pedosphaera sp.]
MHRIFLSLAALTFAGPLFAAERSWNFSETPVNQPPAGCYSTVAGEGKPGTWKVIMDEFPLPLPPLSPGAPQTAPKAVVAQLAWDHTDEHFPMLILGDETYGDFTFKTKFKIADGFSEQMAGVAFRIQDEKNYYYVRASAIANTFYFYRIYKGQRSDPAGNRIRLERGTWHELTIHCAGPKIHIALDGDSNAITAEITDPTFAAGKIAFWTKSDSISYFADPHITYTPREPFAQLMVRDIMKENPRLLGVKVFMQSPQAKDVRLVASNNEQEIGEPGEKADADVLNRGVNYYRKDKEVIYVTMPLRDRNGDAVASVRFVMRSFPGQTEENAVMRATPLIKKMQVRASAVDSLY